MGRAQSGFWAATLLLLVVGCNRDRNSPGWDYFPDMAYSWAYESYAPNHVFADGMTFRTPVKGTIPREMIPFPYQKNDTDRLIAGKVLVNPVPVTQENIDRGKDMFNAFCVHCHGDKGDGQGYLFTSKKYLYPPASLISDQAMKLRDGEIYHTITVGKGIMGAHGSQIRPEDRWKILIYIRNVLQKQK